jgi:hypothetical protein
MAVFISFSESTFFFAVYAILSAFLSFMDLHKLTSGNAGVKQNESQDRTNKNSDISVSSSRK